MKSNFVHFTQKVINDQIGELEKDAVKAFWSEGHFSMHDMLLYLLDIAGASKVYLSTFSISEASIRAFALAMESGLITELHALFDYTIKSHKRQLLHFASNVCGSIKLTPNHSKLILIENDNWKIVVVGSANMTPNPRKEAGVILTLDQVFSDYKKHLLKAMDEGTEINLNG